MTKVICVSAPYQIIDLDTELQKIKAGLEESGLTVKIVDSLAHSKFEGVSAADRGDVSVQKGLLEECVQRDRLARMVSEDVVLLKRGVLDGISYLEGYERENRSKGHTLTPTDELTKFAANALASAGVANYDKVFFLTHANSDDRLHQAPEANSKMYTHFDARHRKQHIADCTTHPKTIAVDLQSEKAIDKVVKDICESGPQAHIRTAKSR